MWPNTSAFPFSCYFNTRLNRNKIVYFSVYPMEIYAISDGKVLPYILDPNFERYLPVIPSEVTSFNFTWRSGDHLVSSYHIILQIEWYATYRHSKRYCYVSQYYYHFDRLQSSNNEILKDPVISIARKGKVPINPRGEHNMTSIFIFPRHIGRVLYPECSSDEALVPMDSFSSETLPAIAVRPAPYQQHGQEYQNPTWMLSK